MSIDFECQCGRPYSVAAELAGRTARCKHCGAVMKIPDDGPILLVEEAPRPRRGDDYDPVAGKAPPSTRWKHPSASAYAASRPEQARYRGGFDVSPWWVAAGVVLVIVFFVARQFAGAPGQILARAMSGSVPAEFRGKTWDEARRTFRTRIVPNGLRGEPVPVAPPNIFDTIKYPSPVGPLTAYLTPDPGDGRKRPAILWITGGDCNSIGELWEPAPRDNDQTAAAYRQAGVVMMFPSLRGGNDNPGTKEHFLGEIDDVLAAYDHLARQPHVDPKRIYLGGHSTGGTLVMLAATSPKFRAVFSFGPVEDVRGYPNEYFPRSLRDPRETAIRSPMHWLDSVRSRLFVFEGDEEGNIDSLETMKSMNKNPLITFMGVPDESHFSVLAPLNELIARKILADDGERTNIAFDQAEVQGLFGR